MAVNVVKLGDVATISAGQSAPKSNYFCEEGIPFVRAGSLEFLERGESIDLCEKISEDNAQICRLKLYPKNSILFAKSGMSANKGRIYKLERSAYIVSHLAIITPDETKLIPEYLMYWLQKHPPKTLIKDESYPSIGLTDIANMEIELPPLDYQKKIAKILDKADEIRAKKKLANDKLDEFLKSTFISMFGDPVNCTKGFDTKHFADICKNIFGGGTPSKAHPEYYIGEIPWVTPKDMKTLIINSSIDYINENAVANSSTKLIPVNSLLMVIRSGILKHTLPVAINKVEVTLNQDMKAFVLNEELANVYFVLYQLKLLEKIILKNVRSVTADNIEFNLIKNLELNVPPLELQNKFAQIVEHVDAQKQKNELVIEQMNNLFNSLSQRAFKGEL